MLGGVVVLHGLFSEQVWIGFAVEELLHRVVLAEGVVGEEDVVAGQKGGHGIGPMEHRHLHEHQALAVADLQGVLGAEYFPLEPVGLLS